MCRVLLLDIETWKPAALDWKAPPTSRSAAKPDALAQDIASSGRVTSGQVWVLDGARTRTKGSGAHYLICDSAGREPQPQSTATPVLRHVVIPGGSKTPKWWVELSRAARLPTTVWNDYWPGWEPLRAALAGEAARAGWSVADLERITHNERAGCWVESSSWEFIPQEAYELLAEAGKEKGVFSPSYGTLLSFFNTLRAQYEVDAGFVLPLFQAVCRTSDLVLELGGTPAASLLAAEVVGCRCVAVDPRPGVCELALVRWEALTGLKAEQA